MSSRSTLGLAISGGMKLAFPEFRPRPPWWGPDLQTLRNVLSPPGLDVDHFASERLTLPLDDGSGDALSALLQRPAAERERPLAVLIHGLSGSEDSAYVRASAAHLLASGHPVLRLNLRGAGPSRPLCRLQYHAGRSADLRDALRVLPEDLSQRGIVLVGYSLGANMLLKFLAEFARDFPIVAAASVSAPIDLAAASQRFLDPRNRFYHSHLLQNMKRESLDPGSETTEEERTAIHEARSIYEFDDRFVGPRNGYPTAEAYYADNAAMGYLGEIDVPTLVIHARDDPWIRVEAYTRIRWQDHPQLTLLLPRGGGHVGFHARGSAAAWHDRCINLFFGDRG